MWNFVARRCGATSVLALLLLLPSCGGESVRFAYHDRDALLSRDDVRDRLSREPAAEPGIDVPIPPLAPVVQPPPVTQPAAVRLLTVQTDGSAPVGDLLLGMARTVDVDIDIDPAVSGSVRISATERPFLDIVDRIASRANLRWEFRDGYLVVEPDAPVLRNYRIDYLNIVRQTESSATTAGGLTSDGANGSESSVTGRGASDFWKELETNISGLLGLDPLTGAAPAATAAEAAALPIQPVAVGAAVPNGGLSSLLSGALGATAPDSPAPAETAEEPVPVAEPVVIAAAPVAQFTTNRQAGLLSVRATDRQHRLVADYLRQLRRTVGAQVLIEARVVEVALTDEFESGINWRSVFGGVFEAGASFGQIVSEPPFTGPGGLNPVTPGRATLALSNNDITAVANLVQRFGTVRTLSSPRVTVVQNETAVLKVAENQVYFKLDFQTQLSSEGGLSTTTVSSELNTVPVGVIITVQPSINADTGRVSLAVRPTVTRIVDFVADPAVAIASGNRVESLIPVVAVQELDSVVTMGSGQVLVMGGLMQDSTRSIDTGLPVVSGIPLLGYLFKARNDATAKSELVIFLKATIVEGSTLDDHDSETYQSFGQNRRQP